ncbi:MAG: quinolinate synthase NadA [Euryarchaeota archaeon]|nr:quinolinate synthase NadA [Euryarchaeota archaeon]MBT4982757.1 quinolinate synthase NadA [Euryarchaeota archaeon]MBT5184049.1 quinolinate synthase NadA [Euryarchaeota archaeon]
MSLPMCAIDFTNDEMGPEESAIAERISELKKQMGEDLLILGHHYQRDQIVMHADLLGDSFLLSELAAKSKAKNIVFCGVHFMAESADILTSDEQRVILPNMRAGCSMADMAALNDVEIAWEQILESSGLSDPATAKEGESCLIPVTYMNSAAELKDFCGSHGGIVCTSSNAVGVLEWAYERAGPKGAVLFFPDQHLGRNTGLSMGISLDRMAVWTPDQENELPEDVKVILWHGFCSVHKRFTVEQIDSFRDKHPDGLVVVHPECPMEVVQAADANGSTEFIRRFVAEQKPGTNIAVGTEINMVARLDSQHSELEIECLEPTICPCSTMYMIHPVYLMDVLERLAEGEIPNQVIVEKSIQKGSKIALERMLSIKQ